MLLSIQDFLFFLFRNIVCFNFFFSIQYLYQNLITIKNYFFSNIFYLSLVFNKHMLYSSVSFFYVTMSRLNISNLFFFSKKFPSLMNKHAVSKKAFFFNFSKNEFYF